MFLSWISSVHSGSDVASLHTRGRDGHCPVGPGGAHRLLGADRPSPSADVCCEAGVLGGENSLGALAVWTDRDRQDRHRRNDSSASGRTGFGMRPVVSAHLRL